MKKKNKFILGTAGLALSLMALGACMYGLNTETKTASADTVSTSPYCLTYGVTTDSDGTRTVGSPDNFKVYMKSSRSSGSETVYNGHITNFSQYYFTVDAISVMGHVSFELYKDGSLYQEIEVSGSADFTTNFGALSSGDYTLKYNCLCKGSGVLFKEYVYEYSFEVDVTDPSYSISAGTGSGSFYTNQDIYYSASDVNFSHVRYRHASDSMFTSYYGNSYVVNAEEKNNGYWYFYATDTVGNQSTIVSRYIDTIAPVGTVTNQDEDTVENGGATSLAFIYSATDAGTISHMEYKKPGSTVWETYPANTGITGDEGLYCFRAIDCAGNVSDEYRVYYDRTRPTGCVYDSVSARGSGSITNKSYVKYIASDTGSGIASVYVKKPGSSSFVSYTNGSQLTTQGKYYFKAYDKAGNLTSTTHEITLDKTAPYGLLYANGIKVASGTITNAEKIMYIANDSLSGLQSWFVKKPNASEFETYFPATELSEEGKYEFYSIDNAGNQSPISEITIDRSIPTAQLYVDGNIIANGGYTNGQYIKFESDGTCYVKKPGATSYISYVSGTEFYEAGKYEFYAENEAGTRTEIYVVIIDRMPKIVTFGNVSGEYAQGPVTITWPERDPNVYAPISKITINGVPFEFGSTVYPLPGVTYDVLITDKAGTMFKQTFKSNLDVMPTETIGKQYYEVVYDETQTYDFPTFEAAAQFALYPQRNTYQIKEWNTESWDQGIPMDTKDSVNAKNGTYYVYKSEEDPDKLVAYFTFERLEEVAYKYAKESVKAYYFWEKEPVACIEGVSLDAYAGQNKVVGAKVELLEGYRYTLDGVGYAELTITKPGAHTLIIEDGYGGSVEFEIYILNSAPTIQYALGDNSPSTAEYDRTYYFKDRVTVSIPFEGDEFAMFIVYDEQGNEIGYFDIANACYIEESGIYSAMAVNHYGETEEFKFVVSMNAPAVALTENTEAKRLDVVITESEDKGSNITFLEITKSVDGGNTWEILTQDDYGTEIIVDTLKYHFRTSGIYKVVVMDEFRTGIDAITDTLEYKQAAPEGVLAGVVEFGTTSTAVTFTWTDEAMVTLTKNGVALEYVSGQDLTEDGAYVLTFSNYDQYKRNYYFTIDTIAPEITLNGVENDGVVSGDVSATFETGAKAEIFKNNESLGAYLGGRKVTEDGVYRIVVKDKAGNESAVEFTIDKTVDWSININEQGLANSVVATANETVTVTLLKDGGEVEYTLGDEIALSGEYTLTLTDSLGNTASRSFTIVQAFVREFAHDFNRMPNFETVLISGEVRDTNYGILRLTDDGVYDIGVVAAGETYNFTVTVDATAPTIVLNGVENGKATKSDVSITTTDDNDEVTLYLNDEEIEYTLGDVLTEEGNYRAVATDVAGNVAEACFTIDKTAPVITLNGVENGGSTKGGVSITEPSETATVKVVKDGKELAYNLGDELKGAGRYAITVTDESGNVSNYSFEIAKGTSTWAVVGIVAACVVAIGGVVFIILKKRGVI